MEPTAEPKEFFVSRHAAIDYGTSVQIAVEWLVALCFLVVGLSHILQPRAWVDFSIGLREKGSVRSLQLGLLYLPLALVIVVFHNIWQGMPLVVTLIGWSQLLKSFLYLILTGHGLRMLATFPLKHRGAWSSQASFPSRLVCCSGFHWP